MQLIELEYSEFDEQPQHWRLHPLALNKINLIVGRNASGKSRVLNIINAIAQGLAGVVMRPAAGNYDLKFSHEGKLWRYHVRTDNAAVLSEFLDRDNEMLLKRGAGGLGEMMAVELGRQLSFQTPVQMLTATTRNDSIQHPYLAPLIEWANSVYYYPCHTDLGKSAIMIVRSDGLPVNPKNAIETTGVLREGIKFYNSKFKEAVLADMGHIGYDIEDIWLGPPTYIAVPGTDVQSILVKETGIECPVDQYTMSIGMFRALAVVIHLNYGLFSQSAQSVLIDDIGEGLDFDRSSNLIKLVITKVKKSNMQIIMTTNDRYVMNGIDLEFWTVLDRRGQEVWAYNEKNRPTEFEEFRFTGLNNFDFLARDFLATSTKK